ncbi:hypothetical protein NM688_g5231 [Phlebia brevispora]|uniref:Uncharacterized protein n=1 Tax=Phlebia brevispora TaxID=194682 RepID=A0ACC1SYI5_9APHY|nr:hypothetical protein NM688_g5231 [Phlebia brevispora]
MKPLRELREEKHLKEQYKDFVNSFVGPIPIDKFLVKLLPSQTLPELGHINFGKVAQAKTSEAACRALMQAGGHFCPNFKFTHISSTINDDIVQGLRPHVACYRKHTSRIREPADDWQAMEMFVVIGDKDEEDPWNVDPNTKPSQQDPTWRGRTRAITYATAQFLHQMRVFAFSLAIYGPCARLFLWDHSAVLVSEAFDYVAYPEFMVAFLHRFNGLGPAERGWDPTVEPAVYAEAGMLTSAIRAYFEDVKAHRMPMLLDVHKTLDKRYPCYKVHLDEAQCGQSCEIIIRRPFVLPRSLMSRSTKGYIGYHLQEKRLVFLKDFWPAEHSQKPLNEIDAYRLLTSHNIPRLPNVLYAGYVSTTEGADQQMLSLHHANGHGRYELAWQRHGEAKERKHLRIAQDIAYPMDYIRNSKQLVSVIRDALTVVQEAARKAKVLHCDISSSNIMLSADGRGILNDWDNVRYAGSADSGPAGTWLFASILTYPGANRRHTVRDDVEACFWVLILQAYRLLEYDQLAETPSVFFMLNDITGKSKRNFLLDRTIEAPHFESAPLNDVILRFRKLLADHHVTISPIKDGTDAITLLDEALRRTDWPEADAHHTALQWEPEVPTDPFSVREYVSGWSAEELDFFNKPEYWQLAASETEPIEISAPIPAVERTDSSTEPTSLQDSQLSSQCVKPQTHSKTRRRGLQEPGESPLPPKRRRLR